MGGTSSQNQQQNQQQTQTTTPWGPGAATMQGILANLNGVNPNLTGVEQGALGQLTALGQRGNQFAPQIGGVANTLLSGGGPDRTGMINDAYSQYQKQLSPYLQSSFLDPRNTPGFGDALSALNSDITGQVNGMFAGAGRDMSGYNQQALARGLSQGEGGLIANQYNQNVAAQQAAAGNLFGAGGTTTGMLSGLDQTRLGNMQAGIGAAGAANEAQQYGPMLQLQAEAQRRGIPLQTLAAQMGIALPASQAFGTTTGSGSGSGNTQSQMSGAQQFALLSRGAQSLFGQPQGGGILPFGS
jgi:hypothetical protein